MAEGENNLRPQFIQFNRCRNVLIENVRIRNSPFWTIHLFLSESIVVRGIDIRAHGHNNDGIDPEMTRNLLVENCRFDQGDDAIAIKSGSNHDGWRLDTPSENIVIRNCDVIEGHQLVAIGSELSGGIRNVYVHDCKFAPGYKPFNLLFIKTNIRRGGFVRKHPHGKHRGHRHARERARHRDRRALSVENPRPHRRGAPHENPRHPRR